MKMTNKNKYTKLEIKLYEDLTKIHITYTKMIRIISERFSILSKNQRTDDKKKKWIGNIFEELIEIRKILKEAKIPKKFLILNKL